MTRCIAIGALLLVLPEVGCTTEARGARPWSATIEMRGEGAAVAVDVPGLRVGVDYHIHLALDGGPEVMVYAGTYTFKTLSPGSHRVRITIADPAHVPIPGMQRTLELNAPGR